MSSTESHDSFNRYCEDTNVVLTQNDYFKRECFNSWRYDIKSQSTLITMTVHVTAKKEPSIILNVSIESFTDIVNNIEGSVIKFSKTKIIKDSNEAVVIANKIRDNLRTLLGSLDVLITIF